MSETHTYKLPEILDFREGPGILATDFRNEGVPLIRLAGLKSGAELLNGCNFLDPDMVAAKWSHFRVERGDVLLSTSASLGEVAVVRDCGIGAVPYTGIIRFRPRDERVAPEFIRFALASPDFKEQIAAMGVGSVMNHFGPSHLKHMTLRLPAPSQQRAIAEVLDALDDKIAANAQLVRTAGDLAAAIFGSTLDDAEQLPLTDVARFVNGKAFTKGASGNGRVVIRIAELNSGIGGSTVYSDKDVAEQHLARPGDLLFAWSGSLTLHRWYRPKAIVNQHIFKVIPSNCYPKWCVYELIASKLEEFRAIAADKATTMGHIQRRHLEEPVPVPSMAEIDRHNAVMTALWERALLAEQESLSLTALRDVLLPEFMSGRLRVKDAEKKVEEVL